MVKLNYGNHYYATRDGKIITTNWRNIGRTAELRPATDRKGYLRVALMIDGKLVTKKVHRLVCELFNDNPQNKPQVNHINGVKADNRAENLEWVTGSENMKHAYLNNLSYRVNPRNKIPKRGILNGYSLLTNDKVIDIRKRFKRYSCTRAMLAKEFGVTENCIKDVVLRKSWKHL